MPPLVVKEGGFAFPLCPSGWHGLEVVDAFIEPQVYHLLKVINKANVTKSRGGSMRACPRLGALSQLVMGCVTCHTCHGCMTDFRPILGNPMEVTHVTSLGHVYIFPC